MKRVAAAGGVLFRLSDREPEVLLIYRRGVWDLPKGKLDPGESPREGAIREVSEEVGVSAPILDSDLIVTRHTYIEEEQRIRKETAWFAMHLPPPSNPVLKPQREEGIEKAEWVSLSTARTRVGFENLRNVLSALESYLGRAHGI